MPQLPYRSIALIEERRMALGTAEVVPVAEEIAGGFMCYSGPEAWSNMAGALALEGPIADDELDRIVEFYATRGVPARVDVCPFADESLLRGLAARGFRLDEFENVLAFELDSAPQDLRGLHPHGWPDVEFVRVDTEDATAVDAYVELSSSGFLKAGQEVCAADLEVGRNIVRHPRCAAFLALVDGAPVGAAGMEAGDVGASLFSASVLPAFRRRGLQAGFILHRLEHARLAGSRLATIHSTPGIQTERTAARLGFFMAYTKALLVGRSG